MPAAIPSRWPSRSGLAQGGMVALLGDRVGLNDKAVAVDFFGTQARFATGPFLLAAILKCPIYLVFGIYREPNLYELYCCLLYTSDAADE